MLFDRYIAVDWSAHNGPKTGRDSIWIGECDASGPVASRNPATRAAAMADIEAVLLSARARGERIFLGFDFVFGFPAGTAGVLADSTSLISPLPPPRGGGEMHASVPVAPWRTLWSLIASLVTDDDQNRSNRFDVAEALNRRGGQFWGHPHGRTYAALTPRRPAEFYATIPERRRVEARLTGPQPVWKLTGAGAVGSQSLLGIPRLEALLRHRLLGKDIAVWPFDSDFERRLTAPILLVEIYPSLFAIDPDVTPRDRAQVEAAVARFAAMDAAGTLATFLSAPGDIAPETRALALAEEGWIAGAGHASLVPRLGRAA